MRSKFGTNSGATYWTINRQVFPHVMYGTRISFFYLSGAEQPGPDTKGPCPAYLLEKEKGALEKGM